jgi:hypothetical protein
MEQLASSILAASLCKGAQFHGDAVIASVAAAMVLIGRKGVEDAFFSAIRANIDDMSAKGREAWCSATMKSAKQRNSDLLTEEKDTIDGRFPGSSWRNRNSAHRSYPHEARPKARDSARRHGRGARLRAKHAP